MLNREQPRGYDAIFRPSAQKILIFKNVSLAHVKTIHDITPQYRSSPMMTLMRLSVPKGYMTKSEAVVKCGGPEITPWRKGRRAIMSYMLLRRPWEPEKHTSLNHRSEDLAKHVYSDFIQQYDVVSVDSPESATLLAKELEFPLAVRCYLDLGCGTGLSLISVNDIMASKRSYTNFFYPSQGSIFCTENDKTNDHNHRYDLLQWSRSIRRKRRGLYSTLDRPPRPAEFPTIWRCPG